MNVQVRSTWSLRTVETTEDTVPVIGRFEVRVCEHDGSKEWPICTFTSDDAHQQTRDWCEWIGLPLPRIGQRYSDQSQTQVGKAPKTLAELYMLCLEIDGYQANVLADMGGDGMPDTQVFPVIVR